MDSVFIKVDVKYRLPNKSGIYITNRGAMQFTSAYDRWYGLEPQWFLEEIELPTEEDVQQQSRIVGNWNAVIRKIFNRGAKFILNKLK